MDTMVCMSTVQPFSRKEGNMGMWTHCQANGRLSSVLLVWALLSSCSVATTPTDLNPAIEAEWALAQQAVSTMRGDTAAYGIWPTQFNWRESAGPFDCGGDLANGCFEANRRRITWNTQTPNVIRHEAGHAILWKLGDDRWRICTDGHGR